MDNQKTKTIGKQEINQIKDYINYLRTHLDKIDTPIFIELTGTPKSGKTTLTKALKNLLEKGQIPIFIRQETAEYNPIENKNTEQYNIWMIMELMKNLCEDMSGEKGKIVIYDRGILDRIPWIDHGVRRGVFSFKDSLILKRIYETDFISQYRPLVYGFITSPELSIQRKGGEGRLVNIRSIQMFNQIFEGQQQFIKAYSSKYNLTETDQYQGRLEEFIIDMTGRIMMDCCEQVKRQIEEKQKIEEK